MNSTNENTRKITLSLDFDEMMKTICAESACLSLMSEPEKRPEIITPDHRRLIEQYAENALLSLAAAIAPAIDTDAFDASLATSSFTLPLALSEECDVPASILRCRIEKYIVKSTLASCYSPRRDISVIYLEGRQNELAAIRLLLSGRHLCRSL